MDWLIYCYSCHQLREGHLEEGEVVCNHCGSPDVENDAQFGWESEGGAL